MKVFGVCVLLILPYGLETKVLKIKSVNQLHVGSLIGSGYFDKSSVTYGIAVFKSEHVMISKGKSP